ncbi:MAG: PhnA domain-containing protein [Marinilabiliaceae bacterium]|nr:PhnA domain-containing protein [Marinilabiliaceae bacterium]
MSIEKELMNRSGSKCEFCGSTEMLVTVEVANAPESGSEGSVLVCTTCKKQIEKDDKMDSTHWRCLNDTIWSSIPAVQVMSFVLLNRFGSETWAQKILDMVYLDDSTKAWADDAVRADNEEVVKHIDSNGNILQSGDTVVLIKDLNVKGGGFTAKRGTAVRNISLVADNPEHIEGKVEGQQIVILTKYVKKSS